MDPITSEQVWYRDAAAWSPDLIAHNLIQCTWEAARMQRRVEYLRMLIDLDWQARRPIVVLPALDERPSPGTLAPPRITS